MPRAGQSTEARGDGGSRETADPLAFVRTLLEASVHPMLLVRVVDGVVVEVNERWLELAGTTRGEATGALARQVMPWLARTAAAPVATALAGGVALPELELRMRPRPGMHEPTVAVVSLDPAALAGTAFQLVTVRPVEPRLTTAGPELRRLEELGRLAGAVAHDFNNLLTVIRSYARLMLDQAAGGHPMSSADAREIESAAARGSELTRRLLAFARNQVVEPRLVDVAEAVRALAGILRPLVGFHVAIDYRIDAPLPPILVDPVQFDQVVLNLVLNAAEAMPDGGRLVVAVGRERSIAARARANFSEGTPPAAAVVLEVGDSGHGMDEATVARAFHPFFTTRPTGTGLGLSVVSGVVRRAGGALEVASARGAGTTVTVLWPVAPEAARRVVPDEEVPAKGSTCVLVVEDHDAVRRLTKRLLLEAGFDVATVPDGRAARQRFESEWPPGTGPTVVLADLAMPHEDGWSLADWLARSRPGVPVVFMSAHSWAATSAELPENVPGPILQKPFGADELVAELVAAVRTALEWAEANANGSGDVARASQRADS